MKRILPLLLLFAFTLPALATNWFIRPDGGTRWSANRVASGLTAQCNGQADAAYPGTGVNQPCAYNDYRFLWDDQTYMNNAWVISGSDIVTVRGGPWRVGWDSNTGPGAGTTWCFGQGNIGCVNPTIPSGTSGAHTKIYGENHASCSQNTETEIFGGYGVITAFNLSGAVNVDVECLNISRHSNCILYGVPALPAGCNSSLGPSLSDYDSDGIHTDITTANVFMRWIWTHGHPGRGVKGPIGGTVSCDHCIVSMNGAAGWDFADTSGGPLGASANWIFNNSVLEWSGCNQEWPYTHPIPVATCYSQGTGGYGDGVGTPTGTGLSVSVDHSVFRYNTQDAMDLGHVDTGTWSFSMTNSIMYSNGGGTFKWDGNYYTQVATNNVAIGDCSRMAAPITGVDPGYNANLGDFCRSGDTTSFNFRDGSQSLVANNTIVTYFGQVYDMSCIDVAGCPTAHLTLKNNLHLGYANFGAPCSPCAPGYASNAGSDYGGTFLGPAVFFYQNGGPGIQTYSNNLYYGMRITCPTGFTADKCTNPNFVGQPSGTAGTFVEGQLDNFNFHLSSSTTAAGVGATYSGMPTVDYYGNTRPYPPASLPSIGAVEYTGAGGVTLVSMVVGNVTVGVGGTATPSCTATYSDSSTGACPSPLWTSATTSVAAVNGTTGLVNGVSPGTSAITATVGAITSTAGTATVTAPPATFSVIIDGHVYVITGAVTIR